MEHWKHPLAFQWSPEKSNRSLFALVSGLGVLRRYFDNRLASRGFWGPIIPGLGTAGYGWYFPKYLEGTLLGKAYLSFPNIRIWTLAVAFYQGWSFLCLNRCCLFWLAVAPWRCAMPTYLEMAGKEGGASSMKHKCWVTKQWIHPSTHALHHSPPFFCIGLCQLMAITIPVNLVTELLRMATRLYQAFWSLMLSNYDKQI